MPGGGSERSSSNPGRPRSLDELQSLTTVKYDKTPHHYLTWCRSVERLFEEGNIARLNGDIEEAYIRFTRGLVIILELIPKLPGFQKSNAEYLKSVTVIFPLCEEIKLEITRRYLEWKSTQPEAPSQSQSSSLPPTFTPQVPVPTRRASTKTMIDDVPSLYELGNSASPPPSGPLLRDSWIGGPPDMSKMESMTPNQLAQFLVQAGADESATVLVLDVRPQSEFLEGHVRWNKKRRADGRLCGGVININPLWLTPGMVSEAIEKCLELLPGMYNTLIPKQLFLQKDQFDLIVYMDSKSSSLTESGPLQIVHNSIYSFETERIPRFPPKILLGGFQGWVKTLEEKNGNKEQWIEVGPGWGGSDELDPNSKLFAALEPAPQRPARNPRRNSEVEDVSGIVRDPYEYISRAPIPIRTTSARESEPVIPPRSPARTHPFDSPLTFMSSSVPPSRHSSLGLDKENQQPQYDPSRYREASSSYNYPVLPSSSSSNNSNNTGRNQLPGSPMQMEAPPLPYKPTEAAYNEYANLPLTSPSYEPPYVFPPRSSLPAGSAASTAGPLASRYYAPQIPAEIIQWDSSSTLASAGLKNLGNTCFMSCILQCLSGTLPLATFFNNGKYRRHLNRENILGTKGQVADAFAALIKDMWSQDETVITPTKFKATVGTCAPQFRGNEQQDAQEFLAFLLDALHEDLNDARGRGPPPAMTTGEEDERYPDDEASIRSWNRYQLLNKSYIVDLFQGQLKSKLECMTCHKTSTTFDSTMYLSLPIPAAKKKGASISLDDCLSKFHEEEILDKSDAWMCPQCRVPRKATKKLTIQRLPVILLIHLKRFYFQGPFRNKIETVVDFPLQNLDLTKYVPTNTPTTRDGGQPVYNLYAVSNHFGGLNGGHYTGIVRNGYRKEWYNFDDARVGRVDANAVKPPTFYSTSGETLHSGHVLVE
ncbi:hypothetical protein SmJEL517_g00050 [Synchytrium microbalum]|uniref:Ubiquitin carboxyl-terminal hydrolase n=1 Tax=Synchytrium microbalum TaxID=1806994 RepID=A0A507CF55_9FUNG|nr:uncharacterized protein SmJEL517_g00050 [Synchytrium microbalum]TPX38262.1 hypothetical protein SmJEL517_g00050 [Synchytrium microbalum]